MNKRRLIVLALIILYAGIYISIRSTHLNEEINDYKRYQKINEFIDKEKGHESNDEILKNESGYEKIFIENKQALLKVMNTEQMLLVSSMVDEAFEYMLHLHKDVKEFNQEQINSYFNENIEDINRIFGIQNIDEFNNLLNKTYFFYKGTQNIMVSIDSDSVKKSEFNKDEITFNLLLKASIEEQEMININLFIQDDNSSDINLIWNID